jgi:hypothetical protein
MFRSWDKTIPTMGIEILLKNSVDFLQQSVIVLYRKGEELREATLLWRSCKQLLQVQILLKNILTSSSPVVK